MNQCHQFRQTKSSSCILLPRQPQLQAKQHVEKNIRLARESSLLAFGWLWVF